MPYKEFEPKDSLEACLTKLWGDPRVVNPKTRLEEIILKIADAQPSGQSIPAPSSPSDGDVLTYDSTTSAWVAEAPSGGVFVITESDGEETGSKVLNKNWTEINTAVRAGQIAVILSISDADSSHYLTVEIVDTIADTDGYSVSAGSATYEAETATGVLTKANSPK